MKNIFKTDGILLSKINISENDLMCIFFTFEYGIIKSVIKYATSKNPKNIGLQIFNIFELEFTKSDTTEYVKTKWQMKKSFQDKFLFDNKKLELINLIKIFLLSVLMENEEYKKIYEVLLKFIQNITLKNYFELEKDLLKELGFSYDLSKCQMCGSEEVYYISPNTGAGACQECGKQFNDKIFILPKYFCGEKFEEEQLIQASNLNFYFIRKHFDLPQNFIKVREKINL